MKADPPRCQICGKRPATADVQPTISERLEGALWNPLGWTAPARTHRRFCGTCRKTVARAMCSSDEKVALLHAACLGIDPVQALLDAMDTKRKQLRREGQIVPGITFRKQRASLARHEPRRPGETANAYKQRRYRARKA